MNIMNRIKTFTKQVKHQVARTGVLGKDFKVKQAKKLGQVNGTDEKAIEKANKKIREAIGNRSSLDHNQFGTDTLKALVEFHERNPETLALVREALAQKKNFQKELFTSLQAPNKQNSRAFNKSTQEYNQKAIEDSLSLLGVSRQNIEDENIPEFQSKLAEATKLSNPSISTNSKTNALEIRAKRMQESNSTYKAMRSHFHAAYNFSTDSVRSLKALNTIKFSNNPDAIKARQQYAENVYNIRDVQQGNDLDNFLHLYSASNETQFNLARKKLVQNLSQEDIQKLAPEAISAFDTLGTKDATEVVFDKKQMGQRQIFAEHYRLHNSGTIGTETDLKLKILESNTKKEFIDRFKAAFPDHRNVGSGPTLYLDETSGVAKNEQQFHSESGPTLYLDATSGVAKNEQQFHSESGPTLYLDATSGVAKNEQQFKQDIALEKLRKVEKETQERNQKRKEEAEKRKNNSAATKIQDQWRTFKTRKTFNKYIDAQKQADELRSQLQGNTDASFFDKEHIQKISDIIASDAYKEQHPDDHLADLTPRQILTLGKALHQLKVISEDNAILGTIIDLAIKKILAMMI